MSAFIYLASQSPRRSQLLAQLGVPHQLLLPTPGEDAEALEARRGNESPTRYVQRVTGLKLDAALARLQRLHQLGSERSCPDASGDANGDASAHSNADPSAPVLCADTTVALGADILGKPDDAAHACAMLARLSGRTHRVLTAVAVQQGAQRVAALSQSWVRFAPMSAAQIEAYVATGESQGKAGAYGVQGRAAAHIAHLRGSYTGIMGLPLHETAQLLARLGWRP